MEHCVLIVKPEGLYSWALSFDYGARWFDGEALSFDYGAKWCEGEALSFDYISRGFDGEALSFDCRNQRVLCWKIKF